MDETTHKEMGACAGSLNEGTVETAACPPAFLEYTWYALLAYAMLGQAWGVVIPSVGGALLAVLAAACVLSVGVQASRVYAPVVLALCTGVSVIAAQYFLHSGQSLANSSALIGWLFTVIIVQALSQRPGFLHRFALAAFAIGLGALPYIQFGTPGGVTRVWAIGTGISNPNLLGMWFGFCTIYFVFWGLQSRNLILRVVCWAGALGSLYVVALTVSRGPVLGIILACIVGLHSVLKRSFFPLLSLVGLIWLVYESGIFGQAIDSYIARGTEETGRGNQWPSALQRLFDSLWTGVGFEAIPYSVHGGKANTPHNGLLYIGLAGGIIPMIFLLGYLARAASGALHIIRRAPAGEASAVPSLVTFALIEIMILDTAFMSAWAAVVFALAAVKRDPVTSPS